MRTIGLLLLGLILVGWAAAHVELATAPLETTTPEVTWVRTVDGWEQSSAWAAPPPRHTPRLHPLLVALSQLLVSALALVAFPPHRSCAAKANITHAASPRPSVPQTAQHLAVRLSLLQR